MYPLRKTEADPEANVESSNSRGGSLERNDVKDAKAAAAAAKKDKSRSRKWSLVKKNVEEEGPARIAKSKFVPVNVKEGNVYQTNQPTHIYINI
jgi:hypothetical protein